MKSLRIRNFAFYYLELVGELRGAHLLLLYKKRSSDLYQKSATISGNWWEKTNRETNKKELRKENVPEITPHYSSLRREKSGSNFGGNQKESLLLDPGQEPLFFMRLSLIRDVLYAL